MSSWIRRQTVRERCVILIQCIYLLLYLSIKHNHSLIEVCTDSYHRLFQHFAFYHVYIEDIVFHLTFAHVHLNTQDPDAKNVSILFSYKESIKTHRLNVYLVDFLVLFYIYLVFSAVCNPPCQNNGICEKPNVCHCQHGFQGPRCEK